MQYALAREKAAMQNEVETQRLTLEQNESAEEVLSRQLENKKLQQDHNNEIKKAEQDLEKRNMGDQNMLKHKAISMALGAYAGKYVEKCRMTNLSKDDPSSAVLAGLLAKYDIAKQAVGANE